MIQTAPQAPTALNTEFGVFQTLADGTLYYCVPERIKANIDQASRDALKHFKFMPHRKMGHFQFEGISCLMKQGDSPLGVSHRWSTAYRTRREELRLLGLA